jgi:TolB-like protein/Flp pilus assembly protein TadD
VRNKLDLVFDDLGDQTVKNIDGPVRAWRTKPQHPAAPQPAGAKPVAGAHAKPSVAVLPFVNMSGDPEQEYFSDGITEDIITEVSRFRELFVTARNSAFAFKGQSPDVRTIGEKLGVQFVVEGSVRRAGNRVRVTAQLVETASGNHVWAERYDRDLADIFEVQDELAHAVASMVAGKVRSTTAERAHRRPTSSMTAHDYYLRAIGAMKSYLISDENKANLEKAIEIDPEFAAAHAALAMVEVFTSIFRNDPALMESALGRAERAVQIDPNDSRCQSAMGYALLFRGRLDESKTYLDRSIALNPNDAWTRGLLASCLLYQGRLEEALAEIDLALKLDPFDHDWFWDGRGTILMCAGRYHEAVDAFQRLRRHASWTFVWMGLCMAQLGRLEEARRCMAQYRLLEPNPAHTIDAMIDFEPYRDPAVRARLKSWLREFGLVDARGEPVAPASGGSPAAG